MTELAFFFQELITTYGSTTYRGLTRWARVAGRDSDLRSGYGTYLCGVMQSDFQSVEGCETTLREIACIEAGESAECCHSGNQWITTIRHAGVQINHHTIPEWDEQPEGHFTFAEFKAALEGWRRFLQMPASLDSRLVITLPDGETAN